MCRKSLTLKVINVKYLLECFAFQTSITSYCKKFTKNLELILYGSRYTRMDQVKLLEDSLGNLKGYDLIRQTIFLQIF